MHKPRITLHFLDDVPRPPPRVCDHPGCAAEGEHRAPKSRDRLNEYWWFCLDHVRAYNKAWDFYAGMSEREIEEHIRRDTTWQRPSWPMGDWRTRERETRDRVINGDFPFGAHWQGARAEQQAPPRRPRTPEEEALAVLDLEPGADFTTIKNRYRDLAKKHHPDRTGGDKDAEERLKRINQAYNTLKAANGGA